MIKTSAENSNIAETFQKVWQDKFLKNRQIVPSGKTMGRMRAGELLSIPGPACDVGAYGSLGFQPAVHREGPPRLRLGDWRGNPRKAVFFFRVRTWFSFFLEKDRPCMLACLRRHSRERSDCEDVWNSVRPGTSLPKFLGK